MTSYLLRITPEHNFDVHVLRTFTRDLNAWIVRLTTTAPHASETINHVIYALNLTFRDVEQAYLNWRNERVQSVLRSGFQYARARIQAALWRRERGRPNAFPIVYPPFQFSGGSSTSPERQPRTSPTTPQDGSYYQAAHGAAVPGASTWASPQSPQPYAIQPSYPRHNEPAALPQAGAMGSYTPGFAPDGSGRVIDYPPPPYPPANWKPPDPVPGSPPVPAMAQPAVEVAIRYLEIVNKAVNICIDLEAL